MLKNTFIHIPGIGPKTEQRFWDSGIHNWNDFTPNCPIRLPQSKMDIITSYLEKSKQNRKFSNPNYFSDLLPANQHWRFFPEFRESRIFIKDFVFVIKSLHDFVWRTYNVKASCFAPGAASG